MADIHLSETAAARVAVIAQRQGREPRLRLSVDGGGCAGFQYKFELSDPPSDDDIVVKNGDAQLVIDSISLPFVEGATVDFVESLGGAAFQVKNPQAQSNCGCGTSFSV